MNKYLKYIIVTVILIVIGAGFINVYAESKLKSLKNERTQVKKTNSKENIPNEDTQKEEEVENIISDTNSNENTLQQENEIETSKGYLNQEYSEINKENTVSSSANPDDLYVGDDELDDLDLEDDE